MFISDIAPGRWRCSKYGTLVKRTCDTIKKGSQYCVGCPKNPAKMCKKNNNRICKKWLIQD